MKLDPRRVLAKSEIGRVGELNYVARFNQNYGFENGVFEFLLRQKDLWADKLFYVPEQQLLQWIQTGSHPVRELPLLAIDLYVADYELVPISLDQFLLRFGSIADIDLTVIKSGSEGKYALKTGQSVSLNSKFGRHALAMHVGGRVTALKWAPYADKPYLAVYVINSDEDIKATVAHPELSIFPGKPKIGALIKSAIQIWQYDPNLSLLSLQRVIDTSCFGATSDLRWSPARFEPHVIGVLSGAFADGSVHFFKISDTSLAPVYEQAVRSSYTVSCKNQRCNSKSEHVPITSFDFLDHRKIIVGTFDGAIAEYIVGTNQSTELSSTPSFVQFIAEAAIKSVTVGRVDDAHIILCHTMGNQGCALHYENLRFGRVYIDYTNSLVRPTYHAPLRAFVVPDSAESLSLAYARHPQLKASVIIKSELVSSFHTSEYLSHPFAIVGSILGQVFVVNMSRKIFAMPKGQQRFVIPLKIWSLYQTAGSAGFTLNGDYEQVASDRSSVVYTFTPPEVVILASGWNETIQGSSAYAFGTYTGLLVVERLDNE